MHQCRQTTVNLLAALLLVMGGAEAVRAQATPPFNPNADSAVDDIDSGDGGSSDDWNGNTPDGGEAVDGDGGNSGDGSFTDGISGTTDEVTDIIENTTGDIDSAIQDQLGDITDPLEDVTGDLLGNNGSIEEINNTIGDAFGAFEDIQGAIGGLTDTFSSLFDIGRLMDIFNMDFLDIFNDPLGGLAGGDGGSGGGGETINIETGALGLPDPKQIEEEIQNAQSSPFEEIAGSKTGGNGSPVIKLDLVTQFERNMTDEVASQTALTEDGQQKLRENAEAARTALETSQELAADSEGQDVSQNILRNISTQLAAQQQTGTLTTVDNQLRARDDALRNKMLVDAVRELQGERIQNRREDASAYSDAITQGGQLILPGVGIDPAGTGGGGG